MKSSNLRHCQACSQNKGLSRDSQLWTDPSSVGDRQVGAARAGREQSWLQRGISTKLKAGFIANQDFLGFWMVDIHQEGHSQRSAPQKRHTAHLRRCTHCAPRKLSGWDGGGDKTHPPPRGDCACQAPDHLSCLDLRWAQNAGPTKSVPLWST